MENNGALENSHDRIPMLRDSRTTVFENLPGFTLCIVMGILSIGFLGPVGIGLGIVSLIQAAKGQKLVKLNPGWYSRNSYANIKAGKVCAIFGIVLQSFLMLILLATQLKNIF